MYHIKFGKKLIEIWEQKFGATKSTENDVELLSTTNAGSTPFHFGETRPSETTVCCACQIFCDRQFLISLWIQSSEMCCKKYTQKINLNDRNLKKQIHKRTKHKLVVNLIKCGKKSKILFVAITQILYTRKCITHPHFNPFKWVSFRASSPSTAPAAEATKRTEKSEREWQTEISYKLDV